MPATRSSKERTEARIIELIREVARDPQGWKHTLMQRWGIGYKAIEKVYSHAQAKLKERYNRDFESQRNEVLSQIDEHIRMGDPAAPLLKLKANILGLEAPKRLIVDTPSLPSLPAAIQTIISMTPSMLSEAHAMDVRVIGAGPQSQIIPLALSSEGVLRDDLASGAFQSCPNTTSSSDPTLPL